MPEDYQFRMERIERFRDLNDSLWGAGNWVECDECPRDDEGQRVFHHWNAHTVA